MHIFFINNLNLVYLEFTGDAANGSVLASLTGENGNGYRIRAPDIYYIPGVLFYLCLFKSTRPGDMWQFLVKPWYKLNVGRSLL